MYVMLKYYINALKKIDDIYSDENENNWIDACGSLMIGDFIALYKEDVIKKISKLYPKADLSILDIIEVVTEMGEEEKMKNNSEEK